MQDAITIFLGIFLEAIPFILLGVVLSAIIAHYVKAETIIKLIPNNKLGSLLFAVCLGFLFPVCECGNIPVARRLIKKEVKPYIAITFLLSAPVINPVVFLATYIAFRNNLEVVYFRYLFTLIIALTIGFLFSLLKDQQSLLKKSFKAEPTAHVHNSNFATTLKNEFFEMTGVLTIGGLIASFTQLILPRQLILNVGQNAITSVFAMSALAFITSICSTVDSFFALGFSATFSTGSILAFLVLGPMLDIKAIIMMATTFSLKAILAISILVTQLSLVLTLLYNLHIS